MGNIGLPGIDDGWVFDGGKGFQSHPALVLCLHRHLEVALSRFEIAAFGEVAGISVKGHGGFGFRKEDSDLQEAFNAELTADDPGSDGTS